MEKIKADAFDAFPATMGVIALCDQLRTLGILTEEATTTVQNAMERAALISPDKLGNGAGMVNLINIFFDEMRVKAPLPVGH
jgi:hypothetical protein